jgi:hypothetical protein
MNRPASPPGKLFAGLSITVEPGLYYPGVGGVRIEDVVIVGKTGVRNLTKFEEELELRHHFAGGARDGDHDGKLLALGALEDAAQGRHIVIVAADADLHMALAFEHVVGRIDPDPEAARQVDFHPGVAGGRAGTSAPVPRTDSVSR